MKKSIITSIIASQASTDQSYPAVDVAITTGCGAVGRASSFEKGTTSPYRPSYLYDGMAEYDGHGVRTAAGIINKIIAPALLGLPADMQGQIDGAIKAALEQAGIPGYINVTAPVSVAALKAAASAQGMPLYRHLGGQSAFTLPVGGQLCASGSKRYGEAPNAQGGPFFSLVSYGFDTFAEAHYGLWEAVRAYEKLLGERYSIVIHRGFPIVIPAGKLKDDCELLALMAEGIEKAGHIGRVGIHLDVGAQDYFDPADNLYKGLFSAEDKTGEALLSFCERIVKEYPIVILQDPLQVEDLDGYRRLVEKTGIQIVGGQLTGTDFARIKRVVSLGCVNAVQLPLCGFGTVSDAVAAVRYIKNHGIDVFPRAMCGEGNDNADIAVAFTAGSLYFGGIDPMSNRLLEIEAEVGPRARFYGQSGLQGARFALKNTMA